MIVNNIKRKFDELELEDSWYYPDFISLWQITLRGGKKDPRCFTEFVEQESVRKNARSHEVIYKAQCRLVKKYLNWFDRFRFDQFIDSSPSVLINSKETKIVPQENMQWTSRDKRYLWKMIPGSPTMYITNHGPIGGAVEKSLAQKTFEALEIVDREIDKVDSKTKLQELKILREEIIDKCMCADCQKLRTKRGY